jgi:hypothetical protein
MYAKVIFCGMYKNYCKREALLKCSFSFQFDSDYKWAAGECEILCKGIITFLQISIKYCLQVNSYNLRDSAKLSGLFSNK